MKASYEIDKIKAVVLYILKRSGGTLDFITLFKKMYFVQQRFLVTYGRPIFKDSFRAVKLGPVPSFTYMTLRSALSSFENSTNDVMSFCESFKVNDDGKVKTVSALAEPDTDELAVAEIRIIDQILLETKEKSPKQLSDDSHKDKAWIAANKRALDDPTDNYIPLVNIARAGGAGKQILEHLRQAQAFEAFCKA